VPIRIGLELLDSAMYRPSVVLALMNVVARREPISVATS